MSLIDLTSEVDEGSLCRDPIGVELSVDVVDLFEDNDTDCSTAGKAAEETKPQNEPWKLEILVDNNAAADDDMKGTERRSGKNRGDSDTMRSFCRQRKRRRNERTSLATENITNERQQKKRRSKKKKNKNHKALSGRWNSNVSHHRAETSFVQTPRTCAGVPPATLKKRKRTRGWKQANRAEGTNTNNNSKNETITIQDTSDEEEDADVLLADLKRRKKTKTKKLQSNKDADTSIVQTSRSVGVPLATHKSTKRTSGWKQASRAQGTNNNSTNETITIQDTSDEEDVLLADLKRRKKKKTKKLPSNKEATANYLQVAVEETRTGKSKAEDKKPAGQEQGASPNIKAPPKLWGSTAERNEKNVDEIKTGRRLSSPTETSNDFVTGKNTQISRKQPNQGSTVAPQHVAQNVPVPPMVEATHQENSSTLGEPRTNAATPENNLKRVGQIPSKSLPIKNEETVVTGATQLESGCATGGIKEEPVVTATTQFESGSATDSIEEEDSKKQRPIFTATTPSDSIKEEPVVTATTQFESGCAADSIEAEDSKKQRPIFTATTPSDSIKEEPVVTAATQFESGSATDSIKEEPAVAATTQLESGSAVDNTKQRPIFTATTPSDSIKEERVVTATTHSESGSARDSIKEKAAVTATPQFESGSAMDNTKQRPIFTATSPPDSTKEEPVVAATTHSESGSAADSIGEEPVITAATQFDATDSKTQKPVFTATTHSDSIKVGPVVTATTHFESGPATDSREEEPVVTATTHSDNGCATDSVPNFILILDSSDEEENYRHRSNDTKPPSAPSFRPRQPPKRRRRKNATFQATGRQKQRTPVWHDARRPKSRCRFLSDQQYNFSMSTQDALKEQELLFSQAEQRMKERAKLQAKSSFSPTFTRVVTKDKLNANHWKWHCPYSRLGLPRDASFAVIKKQYRVLALSYHPDKCQDVDATRKFQAVTEAYRKLVAKFER